MKAAITASERGHSVTLAEKSDRLGGQLHLNRRIPGREELVTAAVDLERNLETLDVDILLNRNIDKGFVKKTAPDAVVLATGALPILPDIPGIDDHKVVMAWDVLEGRATVGQNILIIGGNAVGLETALFLANQGTIPPDVLHFLVANRAETWETMEELVNKGNKSVTVLEMAKRTGQDIGSSTRWTIFAELKRLGVKSITGAKAVGILEGGVEVEKDGQSEVIPTDTVVIAVGSKSQNSLLNDLEGLVSEIHSIGDAKEPRNALEAIREGFVVGLEI